MMMMIRPATDADMLEVMRVRNSGREFMTHNTDEITPEQQIEWWYSPMRQNADIWVVETDNSEVIGFCMIRYMYSDGRNYGTLAVLPEYRGQGIGTLLYKHMVEQVNELWIDVRNDNVASMNAALKAGFEVHYIGPEVTELVAR